MGQVGGLGRRILGAFFAAALLLGAAACGSAAPRLASAAPAKPAPALARAAVDTVALPPPAVPPGPPPAIPILMYHVVQVPPPHAPYPELYVTPALFAAQMAALKSAGYQPITLAQAYAIWQGEAAAPAHPIVLSFDDGYVGVFNNAVPLLKAYGWPAVLNLQVGRLNIPGGLTTGQVKTMIADGWEVDDHTVTHPDLNLVSPARLQAEVAGAAATLRHLFGVPVQFFCYPAGDYDAGVVAAVKGSGFLGATTVWPGLADPSAEGYWTLDRVRVAGGESAGALLGSLQRFAAQQPGPAPAQYPPPGAVRPRPAVTTPSATAGKATATATSSVTAAATSTATVKGTAPAKATATASPSASATAGGTHATPSATAKPAGK